MATTNTPRQPFLQTKRGQRALLAGSLLVVGLMVGSLILGPKFLSDSEIHILSPMRQTVTVQVDDRAPYKVPSNQHWRADVGKGRHRVKVSGGGGEKTYVVEVDSGAQKWLVPAGPTQCFVSVDMSDVAYGNGRGQSKVLERYPNQPFRVGGSTYFRRIEIPSTRRGTEPVIVLYQLDCTDLESSPESLLESLDLSH